MSNFLVTFFMEMQRDQLKATEKISNKKCSPNCSLPQLHKTGVLQNVQPSQTLDPLGLRWQRPKTDSHS